MNGEVIIKREQVRNLLKDFNGEIFGALFFKKDGSLRDMICRLHVQKDLSELGWIKPEDERSSNWRKEQDEEHELITVYDMNKIIDDKITKGAYRRINLETLVEIRHGGVVYKVVD